MDGSWRTATAALAAAALLAGAPARADEHEETADRTRELACLEACRDAEEACYVACGERTDDPSDCYEECLDAADECIDHCK